MADFYYKFGNTDSLTLYNGNKVISVEDEHSSVYLLGYAHVCGETVRDFLKKILQDFHIGQIAEIKKHLLGQYLIILRKNDTLYLFSDFLQTRNIYYDKERKIASSSFQTLYGQYEESKKNDYKAFEFLSMRHCLYPVWLGDSTLSDQIRRVRAFEYLAIHLQSGEMTVGKLKFEINNRKIDSLQELVSYSKKTLREAIRHPEYKDKKIYTTITGGFDSRLVTTLVHEYYTDIRLRISSLTNTESLDFKIASEVAHILSSPLKVYETDPDKQTETYYRLTEGLSPKENRIMTSLYQCEERGDVEFGGMFGTELYTILGYATCDELIQNYVTRSRQYTAADEAYYKRFESALRKEFEDIRSCYLLQVPDERDLMRIFQLIITGRFASRFVAALQLHGNSYEVCGTFPIIEAGLRIPYKYLGSKWTLGRYYLIPKMLVNQMNKKVSLAETCHFCPMAPLSLSTLTSYVKGKFEQNRYYHKRLQTNCPPKELTLRTAHFSYSSDDWFEGFMQTYYDTSSSPKKQETGLLNNCQDID